MLQKFMVKKLKKLYRYKSRLKAISGLNKSTKFVLVRDISTASAWYPSVYSTYSANARLRKMLYSILGKNVCGIHLGFKENRGLYKSA